MLERLSLAGFSILLLYLRLGSGLTHNYWNCVGGLTRDTRSNLSGLLVSDEIFDTFKASVLGPCSQTFIFFFTYE